MQIQTNKQPEKWRFILSILISAFIMLYIYTFFHEGGHALVGVLSGGHINSFVLGFNARVNISGGNYNNFTLPLSNIAGMLLPVIVIVIVMQFYKKDVNNLFYHCFFFVISAGVMGSTLAWVIIPVISLFSNPPAGDDVTKFLANSGLNPMIVTTGAILIVVSLVTIVVKKGILETYISLLKLFNQNNIN